MLIPSLTSSSLFLPSTQRIEHSRVWSAHTNIGVLAFEREALSEAAVQGAGAAYDGIITHSTWNLEVLRRHTMLRPLAVLGMEGFDGETFYPHRRDSMCGGIFNGDGEHGSGNGGGDVRAIETATAAAAAATAAAATEAAEVGERAGERGGAVATPTAAATGPLIIFSGGKFEYRKGQDLVVDAFKRFHRQHPDSLLRFAWHNMWPNTALTMNASALVRRYGMPVRMATGRYDFTSWLLSVGLPHGSFEDLGVVPSEEMPQVLMASHAALFMNRGEGCTNLLAKEALATGLVAVLSANTGHLDLIRSLASDEKCVVGEDVRVGGGGVESEGGRVAARAVQEGTGARMATAVRRRRCVPLPEPLDATIATIATAGKTLGTTGVTATTDSSVPPLPLFLLKEQTPTPGRPGWHESSPVEAVAALEAIYHDRAGACARGLRAAARMRERWTWDDVLLPWAERIVSWASLPGG